MPQPCQPVRVLVVDDEHLIADTLSMILEMRGFEVKTAYSGEQAVESAKVFGPDVLVTDVVMSGMNGIETGRCIQRMLASCKVILFSGHVATRTCCVIMTKTLSRSLRSQCIRKYSSAGCLPVLHIAKTE